MEFRPFFAVFEQEENGNQDVDVIEDAGEQKIFNNAVKRVEGLADCRATVYTEKNNGWSLKYLLISSRTYR